MLVTINEKYFDSRLPSYVPQYIVVYWTWGGNKAGLNFGAEATKNFDFKALQSLLDN